MSDNETEAVSITFKKTKKRNLRKRNDSIEDAVAESGEKDTV